MEIVKKYEKCGVSWRYISSLKVHFYHLISIIRFKIINTHLVEILREAAINITTPPHIEEVENMFTAPTDRTNTFSLITGILSQNTCQNPSIKATANASLPTIQTK